MRRRAARTDRGGGPAGPTTEEETAQAVDAVRSADVAEVVVGTDEEAVPEGWDRPVPAWLSGQRHRLVHVVAAADPVPSSSRTRTRARPCPRPP
ncbi:hypothetical protein [Streptomyces sp. NPDC049881]|uniref:hypothetical protein n=1 Tax=Streptomyces sp. NPDC049881 TaxID=3155778 RepID=UPI003426A9A9